MLKNRLSSNLCLLKVSVAAMVLSGVISCSGSSSSSSDETPSAPTSFNMNGTAVKGLIKNAHVSAYGVSAAGQKESTALASGMTSSEDGSFSLAVSDYNGPVIIEVTSLSDQEDGFPSLMVCDVEGGCGNTPFGDDYALPAGFTLSAVVGAVASSTVTANVTALTDLAASYAATLPGGITEDSALAANSQTASIFGITGDILALDVVNLADSAALSGADTEALQNAIVSAALLGAGIAGGATPENAITSIVDDYVSNQGQFVINDGTADGISFLEVMDEAVALIDSINSTELAALETEFMNLFASAEDTTEGVLTDAQPDPTATSDNLLKVKAFVDDLRDLATLGNSDADTPASFVNIETEGTSFVEQVEVVNSFAEGVLDVLGEGLEQAASAIAEAVSEYEDQANPTSLTTFTASNGITVGIAGSGPYDATFTVDEDISIEGVDVPLPINLVANFDGDSNAVVSNEDGGSIDLQLSITGSATNEFGDELEIRSGSQLVIDLTSETLVENGSDFTATFSRLTGGISLDLNVLFSIAAFEGESEEESNDAVSFDGDLSISLSGYNSTFLEEATATNGFSDDQLTTQEGSTYDEITLSMMGTISNEENDSFTINITGNEDSTGLDHDAEQSASNFSQFDFSISLEAALAGIDNNTRITLSADRSEFEQATGRVELAFNGKSMVISSAAEFTASSIDDVDIEGSDTVTVTNQQGVIMTLVESDDALSGTIKVDGSDETFATISEISGGHIVRFSDGNTVSFE